MQRETDGERPMDLRLIRISAYAALIAISAVSTASFAQAVKETQTPPDKLVAEAAALVGKKIADDKQQKIADRSPHARADDWSFGLSYGNEGGLVREASSDETGKGALSMNTENDYSARCDPSLKALAFTIGMDPRLNAKADYTKPGDHAVSWFTFGDHGVFDAKPRKIEMDYNWDAVNLGFSLDRAELSRRGQLVFCPSPKSPDSLGAHCVRFSLKGFTRALDFVCEAK
jgi:hypothetical protein